MAKFSWESLYIIGRKPKRSALLLGLDSAGKTTLLYKLHGGQVIQTIPTIGFNVETIQRENVSLTLWDVGGGCKIPPLWKHYTFNRQGIIFMLDSTDRQDERIEEASKHLHNLLLVPDLIDFKVLVFANKQDGAASIGQPFSSRSLRVVESDVRRRSSREVLAEEITTASLGNHVQLCSAATGEGVEAGLSWFCNAITRQEAVGEAEISSRHEDIRSNTTEKE